MKIIKSLMILCLLISINTPHLAAQFLADYPIKEIEPAKLIATYSLLYQEDSLPPHFTRQEDMILLLGNTMSLFVSKVGYSNELHLREIYSMEQFQQWVNTVPPLARISYRIYKNFPKDRLTFTHTVNTIPMKYEEPLDQFDWQLSADTAMIAGYLAQKATTSYGGREWVAWFTPEIPNNDGPYKFYGLPGFIIKIYDKQHQYVFELLEITQPKEKVMIEYLEQDFTVTNKQKYFKAIDAHNASLVSWVKEKGGDDKVQQSAARVSEERNNPIELKRD
jgi:GLPGLI family protein